MPRHPMSSKGESKGQFGASARGLSFLRDLYIEAAQVHLIRFIRSDGILDVFGPKLRVPQDVVYEYVTGTIDTGERRLRVVHDRQTVLEREFPLAQVPMKSPW